MYIGHGESLILFDFQDGIQNTGQYTINPETYKSRNNEDLTDLTFGFLQINLTDPSKYFQHGLSP